nr:hypothetical protein [Tanacetum cinerariifolium]
MGEDDDEDPEEDLSEEHKSKDDDEDPEEDPNKDPEPKEEDTMEEELSEGQVHPLSPAYMPDPMKLDEHAPVYVPEPQHLEYHAPSDDDIQVEDDDDDPEEDTEEDPNDDIQVEDDDDDPEEDPSEEHELKDDDEDPEEDPNEEPESKGFDETEPFKEDKIAVTPPPSRHRGARISAHLGRREAMIHKRDDILVEDMPPQRIFALTGPPPGCDVAESSAAAAARAPRSQYDFVDTVEAGQGLIRSPGHDTRTIVRDADRAEDASYVRALQASERRMRTSIEEVYLWVSYQAQEGHQAYLSFEAQNRELLARLETLKTHMSRMEWHRQSAEDLAVTQMIRIHTLEARAHTDMMEDANSSC